SSRDAKDWSSLASGVLFRIGKAEATAIDFSQNHDRYLRLRIYNRDDRPLAIQSASLSVIRTRVIFKPAAGSAYSVYYGNPDAHAPSYDLARLLAGEAARPTSTIAPGPEERNPSWREPPRPGQPWSEQHPAILYVALVLAVLAMGIVTVRFLMKATAAPKP